MGWVTKDFLKLKSAPLKDNFVCNLLPSQDQSCCRKEDYEAIEKKWNTCQKNEHQSSYVNALKLIMTFFGKMPSIAKEVQTQIVVKPGTAKKIAPKVQKKTAAKATDKKSGKTSKKS